MMNKMGDAMLENSNEFTLIGRDKLILTSPSPFRVRGNYGFIRSYFF
jgi:hypothetical protein